MRIIAGKLGGRIFDSPRGHRTHPMSERVRGALFNTLGDLHGLIVLDAFSGSGAIAFEAASRGASKVFAVESDKTAQKAIAKNIETLDLDDRVKLIRAFVSSWQNRNKETFDIVIADPPYDDLQYKTLEKLPKITKKDGILVFSLPPTARLLLPDTCQLISSKDYGDATLAFYRKIS
jgi:16S rRNA (guanine966-N2)-methyltransferase